MAQLILPGDAGFGDVLAGKHFSAGTNYNTAGAMPNNGAITITPSGSTQAIPAGYHNGSGQVSAVVVPVANVLTGTTIAGVAGTMPNQGSPTLNPGQSISAGYYSGGSVLAIPHGSQLWNTPGTYTFTIPANVNQLIATCLGGGGGSSGAYMNGGDGGMGVYLIPVTPGQIVTIVVGAGGVYGTNGSNTTVSVGTSVVTSTGGQVATTTVGIPGVAEVTAQPATILFSSSYTSTSQINMAQYEVVYTAGSVNYGAGAIISGNRNNGSGGYVSIAW